MGGRLFFVSAATLRLSGDVFGTSPFFFLLRTTPVTMRSALILRANAHSAPTRSARIKKCRLHPEDESGGSGRWRESRCLTPGLLDYRKTHEGAIVFQTACVFPNGNRRSCLPRTVLVFYSLSLRNFPMAKHPPFPLQPSAWSCSARCRGFRPAYTRMPPLPTPTPDRQLGSQHRLPPSHSEVDRTLTSGNPFAPSRQDCTPRGRLFPVPRRNGAFFAERLCLTAEERLQRLPHRRA